MRTLALALVAALAPLACLRPAEEPAVAPAAAPGLDAAELALAAAVDEERAAERVRALVRLGTRMGGTASGDAAAEHLAEAFAAAGLAVEVVLDPPTWSHGEERWRVAVADGDGAETVLASAWPLGFSPAARGAAPLSLEPAIDVALLADRAPRWLLRGGPRAGGTPAVVLLDGRTTPDGRYAPLRDLPRDAACPAFALSRADGARLRALADGGGATVRYELETVVREAPPHTVVARLAGSAPGGHFLVCAHGDSDSGGPGANDNGSGEAIVLEIASAWAAAVAAGDAPPPAREVRFAIWGKEIHSSRAYLERARAAGDVVLGVLNYDQAGFGDAGDRLFVEPDDLPQNASLVAAAAGVLRDAAGAEGFPARWVTNRSQGGTDSYVFSGDAGQREAGRPAVTLYASAWDRPRTLPRTPGMPGESWNDGDEVHVDFDPYYHSSGDTPANTTDRQPWHLGWGARVGLLTVKRWLEGLE